MKKFFYLLWVTALGLYLPGNLIPYKHRIPFLLTCSKVGVHKVAVKKVSRRHRHAPRTNPEFVRAHSRESLDKAPVRLTSRFLCLLELPFERPDRMPVRPLISDIFHPPC